MRYLSMCAALLLVGVGLACPAIAEQSFQDAVIVALAGPTQVLEKAVPRTDKATADVVGQILAGQVVTDYQCSGNSVLFLLIRVSGNPVTAICSTSACSSLRVGQRVRLQGGLISIPNTDSPGFNPCDTSTWVPGLSNIFVATKVTR